MKWYRIIFSIISLMVVLVSACSPADSGTVKPGFADFDPGNFENSTVIDNIWMPMQPGTKWVHEGSAVENGETVARRIEFTITDLVKEIEGVRTVVAWIVDYNDDEVIEKEIAFYAQDDDGNVWYLGEHPEEYENGEFIAAPTWIAGLDEARPGVKMWADPKIGSPVVYQGWGPNVEWSDYGQVDQMIQEVCVPVDCYTDVLVNAESSLGEVDAYQLKYYARNVGEIRVGWRGEDATQEDLELVELVMLTPEELSIVSSEALAVEEHAYEISDVYQQTTPMEKNSEGTAASASDSTEAPQGSSTSEIIVYASDLTEHELFELDFYDDEASPGKKFISLPNNGDELDPPPENDPHVTFNVKVQSDTPYRCWLHMKVGTPKGRSQANTIWIQLSGAVDKADKKVFEPGSSSYLTAQGSEEGWTWVGCEAASDSLIYFQTSGETTVRLQAGSEGVGFDQFILSASDFLEEPPSEAIAAKQ